MNIRTAKGALLIAGIIAIGWLFERALESANSTPPTEIYAKDAFAKGGEIRCRRLESLQRLEKLKNEKDAFDAQRREYFDRGECDTWPDGMRVHLEKAGPLYGDAACYAEFGTARHCYWTDHEAVRR